LTATKKTEQPQAITIDFDVPATMHDGTVLRANVYRPSGEGRWPVLLRRTPYGKEGEQEALDPVSTARRGYVVVVQDTRGRGRSEGEWVPYRYEASDGADTVTWAIALPYADGQIGMFGSSYNGFDQWAAATYQPAVLKAIVPLNAPSDPFDGVGYRGGAYELGLMAYWHLLMGLDVLLRRYRGDPATLSEAVRLLCREIDELVPAG
jgi:uncharacterized protein